MIVNKRGGVLQKTDFVFATAIVLSIACGFHAQAAPATPVKQPSLSMEAKRDGLLAPVRPLLLPEIADDSKWIGGIDGIFNDREKKIFAWLHPLHLSLSTGSGNISLLEGAPHPNAVRVYSNGIYQQPLALDGRST